MAGYGGLGAEALPNADFAVYVDGMLRAEKRNINHASGGTRLDLALAKTERFLTLVATGTAAATASLCTSIRSFSAIQGWFRSQAELATPDGG